MRIPAILQGEARTRFLQGIAFGAVAAITIIYLGRLGHRRHCQNYERNGREQRSDVCPGPDVRRAVHGG